jgi:hypothetical protein
MNRLAVFVTLCGFAGFGQDSSNTTAGSGGFRGAVHINAQSRFNPVTGAPYSGEVVTEIVQTLADGTHITTTMVPTKVYRDSLGRTREERSPFQGPADMPPNSTERPIIIEITDPVGQVKYTLDIREKVAHRQILLAPAGRMSGVGGASVAVNQMKHLESATPATDPKAAQMVTEKLEPQTIEGVLAQGMRTTNTWPEGSVGNDRPFAAVHETWRSPELKVPLLIKSSDPRSGERTEKLTNISRSEPDQSLFQPPPDYTIVDEKGDFTIKWGPVPQ